MFPDLSLEPLAYDHFSQVIYVIIKLGMVLLFSMFCIVCNLL